MSKAQVKWTKWRASREFAESAAAAGESGAAEEAMAMVCSIAERGVVGKI
jgi:hypothetical protein